MELGRLLLADSFPERRTTQRWLASVKRAAAKGVNPTPQATAGVAGGKSSGRVEEVSTGSEQSTGTAATIAAANATASQLVLHYLPIFASKLLEASGAPPNSYPLLLDLTSQSLRDEWVKAARVRWSSSSS